MVNEHHKHILSGRGRTQNTTGMIPLKRNDENKPRFRKQTSCRQGLEGWKNGKQLLKGKGFPLG